MFLDFNDLCGRLFPTYDVTKVFQDQKTTLRYPILFLNLFPTSREIIVFQEQITTSIYPMLFRNMFPTSGKIPVFGNIKLLQDVKNHVSDGLMKNLKACQRTL